MHFVALSKRGFFGGLALCCILKAPFWGGFALWSEIACITHVIYFSEILEYRGIGRNFAA